MEQQCSSSLWGFEKIERIYNICVQKYPHLPKTLKTEQLKAIEAILNGKDLLLLLPTAYGKSLVFITPGLISVEMTGRSSFTIIVSPLVSLISDGIANLEKIGLQSLNHALGSPDENLIEFIRCQHIGAKYIFLSPEVLTSKAVKNILWEVNPCYLAVDEGHVVSAWGKDFRTDYGRLYEIRAGLTCPMGVFTATLTPEIVSDVVSKTGLRKSNMIVIAADPDRENIFLQLREPSRNMESLHFLRNEIETNPCVFPKTIIFVTSVQETVDIFLWFEDYLREKICHFADGKPVGYLVNYYNGSTEAEAKEKILENFKKKDGFLKLLICTIAFKMGVNIPDIRRVIIWGMPQSAMQLWQEIGRAGRDQLLSTAIIFPFRTRVVDTDTPYRIACNVCIRESILSAFVHSESGSPALPSKIRKDSCCSFCKAENKDQASPLASRTQRK